MTGGTPLTRGTPMTWGTLGTLPGTEGDTATPTGVAPVTTDPPNKRFERRRRHGRTQNRRDSPQNRAGGAERRASHVKR